MDLVLKFEGAFTRIRTVQQYPQLRVATEIQDTS